MAAANDKESQTQQIESKEEDLNVTATQHHVEFKDDIDEDPHLAAKHGNAEAPEELSWSTFLAIFVSHCLLVLSILILISGKVPRLSRYVADILRPASGGCSSDTNWDGTWRYLQYRLDYL